MTDIDVIIMDGSPNYISDYLKALPVAEIMIRRGLDRADATPFLAHCELEHAGDRYLNAFRTFLGGKASRIPAAFRNWPLTSVWAFSAALSEYYGDDGHAVYKVLNEAFGVEITGPVRNEINQAFRRTCRKFGLCYEGSERFVNDYLVQAGIARSQVHHIARAFILAERSFGPAPTDNTSTLNSWEDDAVNFLHPGVRIPKMVLEVDETAHYAFLFTRYRQNTAPRNSFEEIFFNEIRKAESASSGGYQKSDVFPRPFLVWGDNGLSLSIPRLEGRLTLTIGVEQRRLRGGQAWLLPFPWPTSIGWSLGDRSGGVDIVPSARHILLFDNETGRLALMVDPAHADSVFVDARQVTVVATSQMAINGEPSYEIGAGGHAGYLKLSQEPVKLEIGSHQLKLQAKPKPRLWIESGSIVKGTKGQLITQNAVLGIEFGGIDENEFDLAITIGSLEHIEPIAKPASGAFTFFELSNIEDAQTDLVSISAELRLRESNRALVRYRAWLWPGLRDLKEGIVFDSDRIPENLSFDHSRHITRDDWGHICLDTEAAFEKAILAFAVGNNRITFEIPKPGISLLCLDAEGRSQPIKIGDTIVLRDDEKAGSLIVRCPDNKASLNVRGRKELQPFGRKSTRVLSFADLLTPSHSDEIVLHYPDNGGLPVMLARVVPAISPARFAARMLRRALQIKIGMPSEFDAVRLTLESDTGEISEFEHDLSYRPITTRPPNWLAAKYDVEDPKHIVIEVDLSNVPEGLSLATVSLRLMGYDSYRPLRNARGDNYAVVLEGPDTLEAIDDASAGRRFMLANSWMNRCYAQESWDQVGPPMQSKWMSLGSESLEKPGGPSLLLLAAHEPRAIGATRSWVPLAHPLQILPSLYGSPAHCFSVLSANTDEGAEQLAWLAETANAQIQKIHQRLRLWPYFLASFSNFAEVEASFKETRYLNAILRGFDFEKFKGLFVAMSNDPSARWFWRPEQDVLGPAHYGAALGRLIDRLYEAGLEDEGANDQRISAATSLARYAQRHQPDILPLPQGLDESHAILEWVPNFFSGFARASRRGEAEKYLQDIAKELDRPIRRIIGDASFLIRLAPELLAYYLLLWELIEREPQ